MKKFIDYINEAKATEWIAVEVTTAGPFTGDKDRVSQRVISGETYDEMMEKGHTKGYAQIKHIEKLSPWCKTKDQAAGYLDYKEKTAKKGKINKGDADYIVWAIGLGKMNPAGKTSFGWNVWDEWKESDMEIYMLGYSYRSTPDSFAFGAKGSLKEGDTIYGVDNDTNKKLSGMGATVLAISKCSYDDFVKTFREKYSSVCKRPSRAFGKVSDGLPWASGAGRFGQMYSIKGVAEEA